MTEPQHQKQSTGLRLLFKCFLSALYSMPLFVLAPAGAFQLLGFRATESPIFFAALIVFPIVATTVLYTRTRDGSMSLDDVLSEFSEKIGQKFTKAGRTGCGCAGWSLLIAAVLFVVLGIIGLLVFGVRQIF